MKFPSVVSAVLLAGAAFAGVPAPPPPKPLIFAPLVYYNDGCMRCHGAQGELYKPGMATRWTGDLLREKVDAMNHAYGVPGCNGEALDAETALHRAWDRGQTFVAWTATEGRSLEGEATRAKGARAVVKGKAFPLDLSEGLWTWEMPAGVEPKDVTIEAGDGASTTTLRLAYERFSHRQ